MILMLACGLVPFAPVGCKIVKTAPPHDAQAADPGSALIIVIIAADVIEQAQSRLQARVALTQEAGTAC